MLWVSFHVDMHLMFLMIAILNIFLYKKTKKICTVKLRLNPPTMLIKVFDFYPRHAIRGTMLIWNLRVVHMIYIKKINITWSDVLFIYIIKQQSILLCLFVQTMLIPSYLENYRRYRNGKKNTKIILKFPKGFPRRNFSLIVFVRGSL